MARPTHSLKLTRLLPQSRAEIFAALTDPAQMAQWFFGMETGAAKVTRDLRPGGRYLIAMSDGAKTCNPQGVYLEIRPPERLAFTWISEACPRESRVTIDLIARPGGTELVLTHELPADAAEGHRVGWGHCLDHLEALLRSARPAAR
ncbi:MAG TPA: SRPBCC domain-containing protein [Opitutaceae bacterium]|nr:SRPBCC domain-containing protein [Opitutaceae bacterium]